MTLDPITPRANPDMLTRVDYDPFEVMPSRIPPSPRVFASAAQIEQARQRLADHVTVDTDGLKHLEAACRLDEPLPPFKDEGGPPDWGGPLKPWLDLAFYNALAAALKGDQRYRQRALEAMLKAAEAVSHIASWTGHEHNEAIAAARAYDLLAAEGLDVADDNALRGMLWTFAHALDHAGHRFCNNHNVMNAVGRVSLGAALGNRQWIHDTFYGCYGTEGWRYGLIHTLRHDFLADGMQWEGSISYHQLVLGLVCEIFTVMENMGVDLWHRQWPSTLKDEGFDEHRGWGPKGMKSLQSAFDMLIYHAFPNGDYTTLHDSQQRRLWTTGCWWPLFAKAWEVYGESRYAWVVKHSHDGSVVRSQSEVPSWHSGRHAGLLFVRLSCRDVPDAPSPFETDRQFALQGEYTSGCSLFPMHGSAVLRSAPSQPAAPSASLYWGPHWSGHRSPASLHLDIHAFGKMLTTTPFVSSGYRDERHLTWNRTTIAHNTVTVDEKPMFPYDAMGYSIWEYDLWRDANSEGKLLGYQPEKDFKVVRACNDNVYPGVMLDRTVLLTRDFLVDAVRVHADSERQLDWAMHLDPALDLQVDSHEAIDLGNARGYEHFINAVQYNGSASPWLTLPFHVWAQEGALWLWTEASPSMTCVLACDPVPLSDGPEPTPVPETRSTLLVRCLADTHVVLTVWQLGDQKVQPGKVVQSEEGSLELSLTVGDEEQQWNLPAKGEVVRCR